jgi:TPR repeat protein
MFRKFVHSLTHSQASEPEIPAPQFTYEPREWPHRDFSQLKVIRAELAKARDDETPKSAFGLGSECIGHMEWEKAARWFFLAASKGDVDAMMILSAMYARGLGLPQDREKALAWTLKAGRGRQYSMLLYMPPRQFAKEISGKTLQMVEIKWEWNSEDKTTWRFYAQPEGGKGYWIMAEPTDIEDAGSWTLPQWVNDPTAANGGSYQQRAICKAYFNMQEYERKYRLLESTRLKPGDPCPCGSGKKYPHCSDCA